MEKMDLDAGRIKDPEKAEAVAYAGKRDHEAAIDIKNQRRKEGKNIDPKLQAHLLEAEERAAKSAWSKEREEELKHKISEELVKGEHKDE